MTEITNLTPRQEWFMNRIDDCIVELNKLKDVGCWDTYRQIVFELSTEMQYAVVEWEKYYK